MGNTHGNRNIISSWFWLTACIDYMHHVYPGCRLTLPRTDMSCAYSVRGAKSDNYQLTMNE